MYRPPFADCNGMFHNYNYANGPIGLITDHRRRPLRGRRTLLRTPTRQTHRRTRSKHASNKTQGKAELQPNTTNKTSAAGAEVHVNTTNNNATSQNKGNNGVTVINKVPQTKPHKHDIPSTASNENTNCEKVVLGPHYPTEVDNIKMNITTTIKHQFQKDDTTSTNLIGNGLDHNVDFPNRNKQTIKESTNKKYDVARLPDAKNDDSKKLHNRTLRYTKEDNKHQNASTNSFNEIFESLERCRIDNPPSTGYHHSDAKKVDLNKLPDETKLATESAEGCVSTADSMPPLIERSQLSDNYSSGFVENRPIEDTNAKINEESVVHGECQIGEKNPSERVGNTINNVDRNKNTTQATIHDDKLEVINEREADANDHRFGNSTVDVRNETMAVIAHHDQHQVINEREADHRFGNSTVDSRNEMMTAIAHHDQHQPLQIFSNDPAAVVASIQGTVFSHFNTATKRVLNKSLSSTTSQYPTDPAHLIEQLTIVKMHRDIVVDTLEDKKTEVSRLWERLDVMKGASDRLLVSNNELCTERDNLKKQLEANILAKEEAEKELKKLNEKLTIMHLNTAGETVAVQTDQVVVDKDIEKEALKLHIIQLQKSVNFKDNRIRSVADNGNRVNQKLRNELESLRNTLATRQRAAIQRVLPPGPGKVKTDICERTDRRDKLIAQLPNWNYINPCDLDPIVRLGEKAPVLIGKGVFGKVELMQFLPTRTLVAVKTVYLDANAPEKTRNHIRQKFQCEVRAMQVTSSHFAFPFLMGVVEEEPPLRLVALFLGDHQTLESKTISRVLKDGRQIMTTFHWVNVVLDVILGVKFMHENNLLHNDLKGDNILVVFTECRWAGKIIDLGQVSSLKHPQEYNLCEEEKARFRKNHTHIAPELVNGTHKESTASDIFQMGLIIREVGLKIHMKLLEMLGESCINKDLFKRPTMVDILSHKAFDGHHVHNDMRI